MTATALGSVPILMYHEVAECPPAATRRLSVAPASFDEQLAFLADEGFTGMTLSALAQAFETGAPLPARPVVITFDDGYAGVARQAWPLLKKHGFPATVFVTTGWISDAGPHAAGAPLGEMLAWDQIRELAAAGIEMAAHSHSHPQLDQLDDRALSHELRHSRELLEDGLGAPVRTLAYPYGYASKRVRLATRAAGYSCAAAVRNVRATPFEDLYMLPRLTVRRATDDSAFAALATGTAGPILRQERLLTAGWSSVRTARRIAKWVSNHG
jgi:peptidoglycan/xylan/chitin deacetylase (PgdA/CDA1 family)